MTVCISGAAGGLGRAMAVACAQRGYDLFLTDRCERSLKEIRGGIERQYPVRVSIRSCDLNDPSDLSGLFRYMDKTGLLFDMLLNVAGVDHEGEFISLSCEQILEMVRINIEATLRITHEVLTRRNKSRTFHVVNVSSLGSLYPMPLKATYAASKRFLLDFTYALSQELAAENVRVMALCPAGLPTTQEAIRGIAVQGFWGLVTTNRLEVVARKTIRNALRGHKIYIPGLINNLFLGVSKLLPKTLIAKLLHTRWSKARRKHLSLS